MKAPKAGHWMVVIGLAILGSLSSLVTLALSQTPKLDKKIAGITVGRDDLDRVRSLYGPGAESTFDNVKSLCYYVEQDRSYLSVAAFEHQSRIRSVALSTLQNITPGCREAKIMGKHVTPFAGVALGDAVAKVARVMGQPV